MSKKKVRIAVIGASGYTGADLIRLAVVHPNMEIVALTANVMKGDREKSIAAGCDGYIQKPVDVDRLPGQVKSFLKGA